AAVAIHGSRKARELATHATIDLEEHGGWLFPWAFSRGHDPSTTRTNRRLDLCEWLCIRTPDFRGGAAIFKLVKDELSLSSKLTTDEKCVIRVVSSVKGPLDVSRLRRRQKSRRCFHHHAWCRCDRC